MKNRQWLLKKRLELLAAIENPKLEPLTQPADDGEQATVLHDHYVSAGVSDMAFRQLTQIDLALDRMENDEFGVCAACGGPIGEKRLRSLPWAVCCVNCQDQMTEPTIVKSGGPGDDI